MKQRPFTSSVSVTDGTLSKYGNHIVRHLSAMKRRYLDGQAYAATAIALHLCNKPSAGNRLRRFVTVARSQGRLDRLKQMFESVKTDIVFEYILNEDLMRNDALMAAMPPGSIIINATGMGKDLPGSTITDQDLIQMNEIAWEVNYRGEIGFMYQAHRQSGTRKVRVEDDRLYFIAWLDAGDCSSLSPGNCRRAV